MRMLRAFLVLSLAVVSASAQTVTYDCATSGTNCNVAMPDPIGGVPQVRNSTINVTSLCGAGQFVSRVTPRLNVVHPNVGDLSILLETPTVAFSDLVARPLNGTGSCAGDNIVASYADTAPPFACAANPANGTDPVRPDGPRTLTGILPFVQAGQGIGTWQLQLIDFAAPNTGNLNGWSLAFDCSPLNVVTIAATDPTGFENGNPIVFTVTRSGIPALPMYVFLSFSGTATPADYAFLSTSFVFLPAGVTSGTFTITPVPDAATEGPETVIATIVPDPSYVVGSPSSATATIDEPQSAPTLSPWMLVILVAALAAVALLRSQ